MIYVLCFDRPGPGGARHYVGFTENLDRRLDAHLRGRGARLTRALKAKRIGFVVSITMEGGRELERRLKARHNHARLCPICRAAALERHAAEERNRRERHNVAVRGLRDNDAWSAAVDIESEHTRLLQAAATKWERITRRL